MDIDRMDMPTWAWWWPHWPLPDPQLGLGAGPQPSISSCRLAKSRCQHLFISEMKFRRRINHPSYPLCSVTSPYTIFSPFICYSMILCLPGFWNQRPQRPWSGDQRYFGGTKKLSSSKSWGDLVRFPNPLAFGSGLGERTPKKVIFQLRRPVV